MKTITAVQSYRNVWLLALGCLPLAGCGFAFTKAPPDNHESLNYFTCSEGVVGPSLDLIWAGLNLLGAATASSASSNSSGSEYSASQIRAVGITEGILWGASGFSGLGKSSKCRDAKQQLSDRQAAALKARTSSLTDALRPASTALPLVGPLRSSSLLRSPTTTTDTSASPSPLWVGTRLGPDMSTRALPARERARDERHEP